MKSRHNVSSAGFLPRVAQQAQRILVAGTTLTLLALCSVASAIDIGYDFVTPSGSNGPFTFDSAPVVANWTTANLTGGGADITTNPALNTRIQTLSVSGINTALPTDAAAVPAPAAPSFAKWNSSLQALETGPTGNAVTVLMGKFVNTSPNYITDFLVTYDVGKVGGAAAELEGHGVYYSTTGLANSWVPIDDGSGTNNVYGGAGGSTFFFANSLGHAWGDNPLYIIWADDNGNGVTDPVYTIDNMFVEVAVGDLKEPLPPPTPVFGNITPPQLQDFETAGTGFPIHNNGGTAATVAGSQALQINSGAITANPDQVDLRGVAAGSQKVVSMDLKAWENSQTSDFEAADHITVTADISSDGLTFSTITLLDLHGAPILDPFDPTVANPADQLRATFGPTESVNNADQPWKHFDLPLPASAKTVVLHVDMGNDSGSEFMAIDNISVRAVAVPEPASIALFSLGAIALAGYGVRRRKTTP